MRKECMEHVTHMMRYEIHTQSYLENLNGRDYFGHLGIDGLIILILILRAGYMILDWIQVDQDRS
jgi:hypothetical protein